MNKVNIRFFDSQKPMYTPHSKLSIGILLTHRYRKVLFGMYRQSCDEDVINLFT